MLKITIPETELFDEQEERFIQVKEQTLSLEHSLVSISKWEAIYQKPFLSTDNKTNAETLEYIKCMTINQHVDPDVYLSIPASEMKKIKDYISAPMTATTFREVEGKAPNREIITSELIYFWMISYGIPFECEKWHINRLITLIRVCSIKNNPGKKMSRNDILNQNMSLNAARRKAMGSRG